MSETMVERVARAIAGSNGDDFDAIPKNKSEWNRESGKFGGRFRDINEPMQGDYRDMARVAFWEMRRVTGRMMAAGLAVQADDPAAHPNAYWSAMVDAALSEGQEGDRG